MVVEGIAQSVRQGTSRRKISGTPPSRPATDGRVRRRPLDMSPYPHRQRVLMSIRQRVEKGFYDSDRVLDDLSDSLAGAFEALV